jgi:multidrug efflux pump subunit AcrA (membrane-fusion protein)
MVQRADIQKVTLQVHVRVLDGDSLLRPEMLCQAVRFLGEGVPSSAPAAHERTSGVQVPARVVVDDKFVWTIDPEGARARRRPVEVSGHSGDWVLIRQGLNVTDKVIDLGRDQVEDGTRVRAREGE